jgi:hypothetical protein
LKSGALSPAGRSWWAKATFYISWLLYILAILIVPASHAMASVVGPEAGPMASYIVGKFPSWQAYLVGLSVFSVTGSTVEYMLDKKRAPSTTRFFVLVIVTAVITVVLLLRLAASLLVSALLIFPQSVGCICLHCCRGRPPGLIQYLAGVGGVFATGMWVLKILGKFKGSWSYFSICYYLCHSPLVP